MPDAPEQSPLLDLSDLRLTPQWVTDFSKTPSRKELDRYADDSQDSRGKRPFRDSRGGGAGGGGYGERKSFDKPQGRGNDRGSNQRDDRRGSGPPRGGDRDRRPPGRYDRDSRPAYEQEPKPVVGLKVQVEPEGRATEAMAAMIRTAGKAYSVFDAARLVLASGDRFHLKFALPVDSPQKLYAIVADSSLWLSKEEALSHFLHSEALKEFYRTEEVELEEPKGNFTSVGVCGMSGELLGPPSHHSYQSTLHKLHRERFSNLPFEEYKRRVRTDNSPEAIEKWKDSQKRSVQWVWLKGEVAEGEEPMRLKSRTDMETHFRKNHADGLVSEVTEVTIAGNIPKHLLSTALYLHLRGAVDEARKHLLQTAQLLCSGFEHHGLKLFKRRGGKLWVSRIRPRALDVGVVLSDRINQILELVKIKPGIHTKELIETIAPSTPIAEAAPVDAAAPEDVAVVVEEGTEAPVAAPPEVAAKAHELNSGQVQVLKDIHWLNSEGYVIEYADGVVFPGVTEPPPAKPKKAPAEVVEKAEGAESVEAEAATETEEAPASAEEEVVESTDVAVEQVAETAPVVEAAEPEVEAVAEEVTIEIAEESVEAGIEETEVSGELSEAGK
ncbi:hypothetical protein BH11VER1_BH11VER1_10280 [soil metagenome]